METSKEFRMNKVVNYVNDNIDKVKHEFQLKLSRWFTDEDCTITDDGFETFNEWKDFCFISSGEGVLTNNGLEYIEDEDERMSLLDKVEELIMNEY